MTDEEQFTLLFRQHYSKVLAFAARRTQEARAHDVVAETFAAAWRHLRTLPDDPLPWLYRTARNCLANDCRGARRQARLTDRLAGRRLAQVPDHAVSVVEDAGLRSALARLTRSDLEVLLLIGWEDLDYAAAAQVLECSVPAFKVRVHRARKRLARLLAEADVELESVGDRPDPRRPPDRVRPDHLLPELVVDRRSRKES